MGMGFNSGSPSRFATQPKPRSELLSSSGSNVPQHKQLKESSKPHLLSNHKPQGYDGKQESEKV